VPRRKNFAASFSKTGFRAVKQGFSDTRTYSQCKALLQGPVEFLPSCAKSYKAGLFLGVQCLAEDPDHGGLNKTAAEFCRRP